MQPAVVVPNGLELTFERTECMGSCPAYVVTIHRDGSVDWDGRRNVLVIGKAHKRLGRNVLDQLDVALDAVHFFARNADGRMPPPPCDTHGGTTICLGTISTCSDTSHFMITATRDDKPHEVDDEHCYDDPDLRSFEVLLDELVGTAQWIGR